MRELIEKIGNLAGIANILGSVGRARSSAARPIMLLLVAAVAASAPLIPNAWGKEESAQSTEQEIERLLGNAKKELSQGNIREYFGLYHKAAELGSPEAMVNLGLGFYHGWRVETNPALGLRYIEEAHAKGYVRATRSLAGIFREGKYGDKDIQRAAVLFREACEKDDALSCHRLGQIKAAEIRKMMNEGLIGKDAVETLNLFKKAGDLGHPRGYTRVGIMYANGDGIEKDYCAAIRWLRLAAEKDEPLARKLLMSPELKCRERREK